VSVAQRLRWARDLYDAGIIDEHGFALLFELDDRLQWVLPGPTDGSE